MKRTAQLHLIGVIDSSITTQAMPGDDGIIVEFYVKTHMPDDPDPRIKSKRIGRHLIRARGAAGAFVDKNLQEGSEVLVEGRLFTSLKNEGEVKSYHCNASNVQALSGFQRGLSDLIIIGHLGSDPELHPKDGSAFMRASIATDHNIGEKRGTDYIGVIAYDSTALNFHKELSKGALVRVVGPWSNTTSNEKYPPQLVVKSWIVLSGFQTEVRH